MSSLPSRSQYLWRRRSAQTRAQTRTKLAIAFVVKGRAFAGYASEEEMINAAMAHLQSLGSVPASIQG